MTNLSPTARKLVSTNARMRKLRAELAGLVLEERGLVVELKDTEKLTLQKIADLLGVKARQQILAMYQKGKEQASHGHGTIPRTRTLSRCNRMGSRCAWLPGVRLFGYCGLASVFCDGVTMLIFLPLALLAVPVVMWLFPEQTGNRKHYEGDFGNTDQTLRPLDDLSNDEHNAVGVFYGYCQGDEQK